MYWHWCRSDNEEGRCGFAPAFFVVTSLLRGVVKSAFPTLSAGYSITGDPGAVTDLPSMDCTLFLCLDRSGNMQSIKAWLESRIPELVSFQKHREQKADLQLEAKALWLKAEAAGYSVAELKEACNGDVEQYLLDMQNISASAKTTT